MVPDRLITSREVLEGLQSGQSWAPVDVSEADATFATGETPTFNARPRSIYIGSAGNLAAKGDDGVSATFAVAAGQELDISPTAILNSGTTAGGIVAIF